MIKSPVRKRAPLTLMEGKVNLIRQLLGEISEAAWRMDKPLPSLADAVRATDKMESEIQMLRKESC